MKSLPLLMIADGIQGKIIRGKYDLMINDIIIGTRKIHSGTLLFDTNRDKFNHSTLARINFSFAIVTDKPDNYSALNGEAAVVQVTNVGQAYWKFIEFYRNLFPIPVIGVTGTCGKTSTKEMIKHILSGSFKVNATYKSYNALFRNLSYLLEIDDSTQAAVYEMGVAFPGDLKISCRYFKPQVGVITNIGIDHLSSFRTLDGYIQAKAQLLKGLDYRGTLILNADNQNIKKIDLNEFKGRVIYFGLGESAHYKAANIVHENGFITYTLHYGNETFPISIPGHGEFNVYNSMAAIAASNAVGVPIAQAGARLASFRNVEKHFEFKHGINGSTVVDDTWSTNPTSVEAALDLLKFHAQGKTTCAVLGKMSLLGRESAKYHFKTGERVAEIGIDRLVVLGEGADDIGNGALQKGMDPDNVHFCQDSSAARKILEKVLGENSIVLVKTSMMASYADLMNGIVVNHAD